MSKRIVLKSVLAVVVVGFILSMSSCQKDEKKIIGVWLYNKIEVKEFVCSNPLLTAILKPLVQQYLGGSGVSGEVEFTKNGNVILHAGTYTENATYKVSDSKLTITYNNGSSETYTISFPDKQTMCWDIDMNRAMLENISDELQTLLDMYELGEGEVQVTKCKIVTTLSKK